MVAGAGDKELGRRCKMVREFYLGVGSTRELERILKARGYSVTNVTIQRYEAGKRAPGADYLQALAQLAKVDGHWLLTGKGDPQPPPDSEAQVRLGIVRAALELDMAILARDAGGLVLRALEAPPFGREDPERRVEGDPDS